jgi:hypothetical protein
MIAAEIYVLKIDIIDGKDVSVPVKLEKPALIHISAGFLFGTGTDTYYQCRFQILNWH